MVRTSAAFLVGCFSCLVVATTAFQPLGVRPFVGAARHQARRSVVTAAVNEVSSEAQFDQSIQVRGLPQPLRRCVIPCHALVPTLAENVTFPTPVTRLALRCLVRCRAVGGLTRGGPGCRGGARHHRLLDHLVRPLQGASAVGGRWRHVSDASSSVCVVDVHGIWSIGSPAGMRCNTRVGYSRESARCLVEGGWSAVGQSNEPARRRQRGLPSARAENVVSSAHRIRSKKRAAKSLEEPRCVAILRKRRHRDVVAGRLMLASTTRREPAPGPVKPSFRDTRLIFRCLAPPACSSSPPVCQVMEPKFNELSGQYSDSVFLKVTRW